MVNIVLYLYIWNFICIYLTHYLFVVKNLKNQLFFIKKIYFALHLWIFLILMVLAVKVNQNDILSCHVKEIVKEK